MTLPEKYDKVLTGLVSGLILPFIVGLSVFLVTSGPQTLYTYVSRITYSGIVTHAITLCVFPNVVIFLIFNQFDMLRAARGVLAMTIVWAVIVFGIKFFG